MGVRRRAAPRASAILPRGPSAASRPPSRSSSTSSAPGSVAGCRTRVPRNAARTSTREFETRVGPTERPLLRSARAPRRDKIPAASSCARTSRTMRIGASEAGRQAVGGFRWSPIRERRATSSAARSAIASRSAGTAGGAAQFQPVGGQVLMGEGQLRAEQHDRPEHVDPDEEQRQLRRTRRTARWRARRRRCS